MSERLVFGSEHDFLHKLEELVKSGVNPRDIQTYAPHPVHKAEEILEMKPSFVRTFALIGGLTGACTGYLFTSLTALDWPLPVGNKPIVGIPPFTVIAFELMVLFGDSRRSWASSLRRACPRCEPSSRRTSSATPSRFT